LPAFPPFAVVPEGRSNDPGRLPPLFPLELPPLPKPRFPLNPVPPREFELLLLKKCCDLEGTLRNAPVFAARPDGLKLSREGEIGILPETMLAWRSEAPSKCCWLRGTAPRPKSRLDMELTPPCTRPSRKRASTFENRRPPKRSPARGPNP